MSASNVQYEPCDNVCVRTNNIIIASGHIVLIIF